MFSKYKISQKIIVNNIMFFWIFCCVRDIISLYMVNFILLRKNLFYIYFVTFWYPFLLVDLLKKLIQLKKYHAYPLVYLLMKLTLFLSITTVTVERVFFTMNFIKNQLHNRLRDDLMNDCLVIYIEKTYSRSLIMKISFNVFKI